MRRLSAQSDGTAGSAPRQILLGCRDFFDLNAPDKSRLNLM
jgi:hypothetical protein